MSELSSNYFDKSAEQNAYNDAVAQAQGASQERSSKFNEELSKYNEAKEKQAKKDEIQTALTGVLGTIPLEEGVRDAITQLRKKATQKVGQVAADTLDEVKGKVKNLIGDKLTNMKSQYNQLPKVNNTTDDMINDIARRKKLAKLKAENYRKGGKANITPDDDLSLDDDLGKQILSNVRNATSNPVHAAATLSGQDVDDISPDNFAKSSTGFDSSGDLTKAKMNPFSVQNDPDALQGLKEYTQYDSKAAMVADDAGIVKPPASVNSLLPDKLASWKNVKGDSLQPARDAMNKKLSTQQSYEDAKNDALAKVKDPDADIKATLPNLTDDGSIVIDPTPVPAAAPKTDDALGEEDDKQAPKTDDALGEQDASDVLPKSVSEGGITETSFGAPLAETGADAGAEAGSGLAKAGEKALAEGGEAVAEGGGPEDILGDVIGGIVGLGTLLGGLLGKKKSKPPPAPPPLPAVINPGVALGI
jgi:hypothetical protein